jgi:HSP20 family protein
MSLDTHQKVERPSTGFGEFFSKPLALKGAMLDLLMPVIPSNERDANAILRVTSPGYEIHEVEGKYTQIIIDVPGVTAKDITVTVEHNGAVLHVAGVRKVIKEDDGSTKELRFEKRFTIGKNIDLDKMTAVVSHGVLKLTAPVKEGFDEAKVVETIAVVEDSNPKE